MFQTTTSLLPHQEPAVAKMLPIRVGGLFMDLGTGKSRTLLEIAALRQGKWDRLFWFTPCSLRVNVRRQIIEHTDIPPEAVCLWDAKTMARGVDSKAIIHIVGIESMGASDRTVLAYNALVTSRSFVVVDESSYIKGYMAKRTQRITALSERARYRMVLTGTPFTQGAVDLYSQMKFLSPKVLGYKSFWRFAANHLEFEERKTSTGAIVRTGRIIRSHNTEYLAAKIAPYVYQVCKEECMQLPEKLHENWWLQMTDEQRFYYEEAKMEFLAEDYDDWSSIAIFRLFARLQTIVCGFLSKKERIIPLHHKRVDMLLSAVNAIPGDERVIVWGKFHFCVAEICQALAAAYGADHVCPYHGGMMESAREESLKRWRAGARFLVPTQSLASHGLTLTEAAYAIFYADAFKYSERLQAEDRMHRIGQTRRPVYMTLACENSIDERIMSALTRKANMLEDFQRDINVYRSKGLREKVLSLVRSL